MTTIADTDQPNSLLNYIRERSHGNVFDYRVGT